MNWADIQICCNSGILCGGENKAKVSMLTSSQIALDVGGIGLHFILDALKDFICWSVMNLGEDWVLEAGVDIVDVCVGLDHGVLFSM